MTGRSCLIPPKVVNDQDIRNDMFSHKSLVIFINHDICFVYFSITSVVGDATLGERSPSSGCLSTPRHHD